MIKFIINLFVFIIFAFIFYIISLVIWSLYTPSIFKSNIGYNLGAYGHIYTRLNDAKNQKDIDILFIGSSHAYRGFD